jgi:hypothetical protein
MVTDTAFLPQIVNGQWQSAEFNQKKIAKLRKWVSSAVPAQAMQCDAMPPISVQLNCEIGPDR